MAVVKRGIEFARRIGDRVWEGQLLGGDISALVLLGRWEEALQRPGELEAAGLRGPTTEQFFPYLVLVCCARGQLDEARAWYATGTRIEDTQVRSTYDVAEAELVRAEGNPERALEGIERELRGTLDELGVTFLNAKMMLVEALECAFEVGDRTKVEELLGIIEGLRPGERPPMLAGHGARFRAKLAADPADAERGFRRAEEIFLDHELTFWLAVTQLEHAEWLAGEGRDSDAEPLLAEAREAFKRLEARPWLERLDAADVLEQAEVQASM